MSGRHRPEIVIDRLCRELDNVSAKWDAALADLSSVVSAADPSNAVALAVDAALDAAADQLAERTAQLRAVLGEPDPVVVQ